MRMVYGVDRALGPTKCVIVMETEEPHAHQWTMSPQKQERKREFMFLLVFI